MRHPAALLVLLPVLAWAQETQPDPVPAIQPATSRWYEIYRNGDKVGYSHVAWAPSTWQGHKTIHDTTTVQRRSTRNMSGVKNVFSSSIKIELERGLDGTLYLERYEVQEGERTMVTELTWTGRGYRYQSGVLGGDEQRALEIPLDAPVMTDSESRIGHLLRQGQVAEGDVVALRLLDLTQRGARETQVTIGAREQVEDAGGATIEATRVVERDPRSGAETVMWLDAAGAFVQIRAEGGTFYKRVTQSAAEQMPVEAAEYTVTSGASPTLERIFTAEQHGVRLYLQGDEHRKRPAFPDSPWSRVVAVEGDDAQGWVYELELRQHDVPDADARFPADRERFARELEPTVLMPCEHPELVQAARRIVGDETSMRRAAHALARFVYESLAKRSPDVGEATALEILRNRQGDCSEHATLFVTLCRAVGIPARRCSGYVSLGSVWGGHAWAEIWVGDWIAADPTTGELAPGARYLFYGYHDVPGSFPGVVSARASGRMRLVSQWIEEDGQRWDLRDPSQHRIHDREAGRYVHALAGLELEGVPGDWQVRLSGSSSVSLEAPDGLSAWVRVRADQGATLDRFGGSRVEYVGLPAVPLGSDANREAYYLHVDRQLVQVVINQPQAASRPQLDVLLAGMLGGEAPPLRHPGPVSPAVALQEVVLGGGASAELVGPWSRSVLQVYWRRVAQAERVRVWEAAEARAGARSSTQPVGAALLEAARARAARAAVAARVAQRDPAWLDGRELSASWVPAVELPADLADHAALVEAARVSAQAHTLALTQLGQLPAADVGGVQAWIETHERSVAEALAEIDARLAAREAHDAWLAESDALLGHYGLR